MDLADMRFQLFLQRTVLTGDHRTFLTDSSSPDIPESFAIDSNGLSGVVYQDPLLKTPPLELNAA